MATTKRERQKASRREKMDRRQREARRRRAFRRGVIAAVIGAVVIASAALIFSGGSTPTTTTTTTVASTTTTTVAPTTTTTLSAAFVAAQTSANNAAVAAGCPKSPTTRVNTLTWTLQPNLSIKATGTYYAHVATTAGDFVIHLLADKAPLTVNNFIFLAEHKYYNCVIFHRVIKGFVIQGGDPTGTGTGTPGYTIGDELPATGHPTYPLYSVAMANEGTANTGGGQFFIVSGTSGESLPASYSLFGQVVSGQSVLATINSEGGPLSSQTGTPYVIQRMLTVTISSTP
ncbi:MAG: peptidylprolyl isomerase [Acidimicrobiales bacterium]